MTRGALAVLLFAALLVVTSSAGAQQGTAIGRSSIAVEAAPLLGEASLSPGSWAEVLVRLANHGREPQSGTVVVTVAAPYGNERGLPTEASFTIAPGATVTQRLPLFSTELGDPTVTVRSASGETLYEQTFTRLVDNRVLLALVSHNQALAPALRGLPIVTPNDPWAPYGAGYGRSNPGLIEVAAPPYDPATGDAILPLRAVSYGRVAVVLAHSDELLRAGAPEMDAIAGWVLGGGTLGLVLSRPEDQRHERIVRLCGGVIQATAASPATLAAIALPTPPSTGSGMLGLGGAREVPQASAPSEPLAATLAGYEGGNLRATAYGASASYGLGEVHLLAFDPTKPPAISDPWALLRVADLLRRATERQASVMVRPGSTTGDVSAIRKELDPNESSRWAIMIASLLLLVHSVVAGPVNFGHWRSKGKPLRALASLAGISAVTFTLIVATGTAAKGCSGRARHLTFIEAGAGMTVGAARRWRGFFVPSAQALTVTGTSESSVLHDVREGNSDDSEVALRIERDGPRLVNLSLLSWQTRVVREDGTASLGDGITLAPDPSGSVTVVNRTGRSLRGLVLWLPSGVTSYRARLDDGERASSADFDPAPQAHQASGGLVGTMFHPYGVGDELESASAGLTEAWVALDRTAQGGYRTWFPADVPVLLAQIDGGEGRTRDAGLVIEKMRLLVRVVGYGGRP